MVQVGIVALRCVNANPFWYYVASSYAGHARRQPYAIQVHAQKWRSPGEAL